MEYNGIYSIEGIDDGLFCNFEIVSYILIINFCYSFKRIVIVCKMAPIYTSHVDDTQYSIYYEDPLRMAPIFTSHVDDTQYCIYGDDPRRAFSRIILDYRYFELDSVVLRDSECGNRLTAVESRVDSQGVDHEVEVYSGLWYHIPGALNVVADCSSRFPRVIGMPLFPKLLLEHQLGEVYNRAEQCIRAEYFVRLIGEEGEMFYCSYGRLWDDRYLSGWYTDYEFSGNRFTPLFRPRTMAPYDSWYYGVLGIFPWIHVGVCDGGKLLDFGSNHVPGLLSLDMVPIAPTVFSQVLFSTVPYGCRVAYLDGDC